MPAIIIPARLGSTRLPRKLLLDDTGYPLLWHTAQRALESKLITDVIIATEDQEIVDVVSKFGHPRIYSAKTPKCNSGTERISWVVQHIKEFDFQFVVNFQGDEPELPGRYIDELVDALVTTPAVDVATLATPISRHSYSSPDVVKVVLDHVENAMYFSRAPIPHGDSDLALAHVGIYAYRLDFLLAMPTLPASTLESEKLEQLQWLQSGFKIRVLTKDLDLVGIDTKEEYNRFVSRELKRQPGSQNPPPT
jgi:3-deoxy-manno-octulosonate cytidylyltransferase (CMP-KDO synthetase)